MKKSCLIVETVVLSDISMKKKNLIHNQFCNNYSVIEFGNR